MAVFPDYNQTSATSATPDSGIELDVSLGGKPRSRILYDSTTYSLSIEYFVSGVEADALESFYESYKAVENEIICAADGKTYSVIFNNKPERVRAGPDVYYVKISLTGKRQ